MLQAQAATAAAVGPVGAPHGTALQPRPPSTQGVGGHSESIASSSQPASWNASSWSVKPRLGRIQGRTCRRGRKGGQPGWQPCAVHTSRVQHHTKSGTRTQRP